MTHQNARMGCLSAGQTTMDETLRAGLKPAPTLLRMKRSWQLSLLVWSVATSCLAQEIPKWEFFSGYSLEKAEVRGYYKSSPIIYSVSNQHVHLDGWDMSITENLNRWLGGTADISGHYNTLQLRGTTTRGRIYSALYGPRFSFRTRWIIPFVHLLAGAAQAKAKVTPVGPHDSKFSFAMAAGTGVDLKLGKRVAVRLFKAEYFWTNILGTQPNRFRASAGLIFYWGSK